MPLKSMELMLLLGPSEWDSGSSEGFVGSEKSSARCEMHWWNESLLRGRDGRYRNLPWFVCFWTCKNVYSFLFSCIKTHVTCSFFNHVFTLLFFTCKKTIYQLNIYKKPWLWLPHLDVWCNFPLNHHLEINCVLKPGLVYTQKVGYYYQHTLKEQQTMMNGMINGMINGMSTKCLQHLVDLHEQLIHQTMLSWKNIGICRKDCPDKIRQVPLFDSP